MISNLIAFIRASPASASHYKEIENALEQHMDALVEQHHLLHSHLQTLMDAEREADVAAAVTGGIHRDGAVSGVGSTPSFAMAMTYFAAALYLGGRSREERNSAILVDVVERHLLSAGSAAYSQMRGHVLALKRFEQLLTGYIAVLDARGVSNYGRKLHFLHRAVLSFAPSQDHLTVAHALLVQEAAKSFCPRLAISVMRQPVLEISPEETGADALSCIHYYKEGSFLLVAMECWNDAEVWLRSAMSVPKRILRGGRSENTTAPVMPSNTSEILNLMLLSAKAFILVSIILHGGMPNPQERKKVQQMVQQFRGSDMEPYLRLLSSAEGRDGKSYKGAQTQYASLWKKDGLASLVSKAGTHLEHHFVLDRAKVISRAYLSTIMKPLRSCFIGGMEEESDHAQSRQIIQFLLSMMEEGELCVSFEFERTEKVLEAHGIDPMNWLEHGEMERRTQEHREMERRTQEHGAMGRRTQEHGAMGRRTQEHGEMEEWERRRSDLFCFKPSYRVIANLTMPSQRVPAALGESRRKHHMISLGGDDLRRYQQMQLSHAMEKRIRRCDKARAALARVTESLRSGVPMSPDAK